MNLEQGVRLSQYEILAPLGAGGPPPLNAAFSRGYGASTVAMERTST
jgi:hypothetical protein